MDGEPAKSPTAARVAAAIALIVAAMIVFITLQGSLSGGSSDGNEATSGQPGKVVGKPTGPVPARYTVEEGDTLSAIEAETGVPVSRIEQLNPGLDPQALTPGQKLRLR